MSNPYVDQIREQGKEPSNAPAPREVPSWYLERYPNATWDSYQDALHDYLNGM